jgi:Flp pilus assembly secretin CpaC
MTRRGATIVLALLVWHGAGLTAQQPPAKPAPARVDTETLMMVEVTISRHLGDKRLSSTPYSLTVVPHNRSSLRMGGEVPVPTTTFTPVQKDDGKASAPLVSYNYRPLGTNIDVIAGAHVDDKYILELTVEESSIYPPEGAASTSKTAGAPAFRSFKSHNSMALRDGQSLEYVMATDRISGEVYRVNVKMTVVK